jgi:AraC-like DNA-binding protein
LNRMMLNLRIQYSYSFKYNWHMSPIEFTLIPPPHILRDHVECFRIGQFSDTQVLAVKVCPNGLPGIVFQHREGQSVIQNIVTQSGRVIVVPTSFIHGQVTELAVMNFIGPFSTIQVVLKPSGLRMLFNVDASMLINSSMELNRFANQDLNGRLISAGSNEHRISILSSYLVSSLRQNDNRDPTIEMALDLIHQNVSCITIRCLLEHLCLSERQFERRFIQSVGVSPKFYIRVKRVNEALRLMDSGQYERLSDVAHALNFHDQSHFIRDIKSFLGITPKSIAQEVSDFHHDRVGSSYLSM